MELKTNEELFNFILDRVCNYYHLSVEDVRSRTRKQELIKVKAMAAYIATENFKLGYSEIGRNINQNHASIIHLAKNSFHSFKITDKKYNESYFNILLEINNHLDKSSFNLYKDFIEEHIVNTKKTIFDIEDHLSKLKNYIDILERNKNALGNIKTEIKS